MKRMLLVLPVLGLLCAPQAWAAKEERTPPGRNRCASPLSAPGPGMCKVLLTGRGCCSSHKGQCGCQGGRVVCCDGTFSPSCRCEREEVHPQ